MLICLFHIVRYHIFKRKHSFYVQISGSCNKIFFICIFSCKLITDQMTAVIQIFSIDKIIFHSMPAGRLYRTNISTLLRRHQILSHARHTDRTSSKRIQFSIRLIRSTAQLFFCKKRNVIIDCNICLSIICRNGCKIKCFCDCRCIFLCTLC